MKKNKTPNPEPRTPNAVASGNIVWHDHRLSKEERSKMKYQKPCILWFTGLSGSGKSTIANAVEARLYEMGRHTYLLDGDNIRRRLNKDLGFSDEDRVENIRRIGEVARLFVDSGLIILTAFISPFQKDRDQVRSMMEEGEFIEIFVDVPLEVCESRDPKGLYKKARKGEIADFTGISSPYEPPADPEIRLAAHSQSVEESVDQIVDYLKKEGYLDVR
ncbi:adenylyl-sulfate kinase [Hydrogenimonas sp.]